MRTGKKFRSEALIALAIGLGAGACSVSDAPHLDTVSPSTMSIGQTFTLTGERFCQQAGVKPDGTCMNAVTGEVDFSVDQPTQAQIVSWTDTTVMAIVPMRAPSGSTEVYLQSSGKVSNALDVVVQ